MGLCERSAGHQDQEVDDALVDGVVGCIGARYPAARPNDEKYWLDDGSHRRASGTVIGQHDSSPKTPDSQEENKLERIIPVAAAPLRYAIYGSSNVVNTYFSKSLAFGVHIQCLLTCFRLDAASKMTVRPQTSGRISTQPYNRHHGDPRRKRSPGQWTRM
jgi:hypothetical protein